MWDFSERQLDINIEINCFAKCLAKYIKNGFMILILWAHLFRGSTVTRQTIELQI